VRIRSALRAGRTDARPGAGPAAAATPARSATTGASGDRPVALEMLKATSQRLAGAKSMSFTAIM